MKIASDPEATPIPDSAPAVCAVFGADPIEAAAATRGSRLPANRGRKTLAGDAALEAAPD